MYKIAVLGDYDSIYGFAALGLDTFPVTDLDEAEKTLIHLSENKYAVIYVTEKLAAAMPRAIERFKESLMPSVILIPGVSGNTGAGVESVKKSVEQAVGSDIIFSNN